MTDLAQAAQSAGLRLRGGFYPTAEDAVPPLPDGKPAVTLVLLGFAGKDDFAAFSGSPEARDGNANPLDRWSQRVIAGLAVSLNATALFPFGPPPWLPFQRWARKAEPVHVSPLGMLIHPRWGLWHSYRGALAFGSRLELEPQEADESPCSSCREKPCLTACPVNAFTADGYDVAACRTHIKSAAGTDCMTLGCKARRACPVGQALRYDPVQASFHMRHFAGQ